MVAERMQMTNDRLQAGVELAGAIMGLTAQLAEALQQVAVQGLITRLMIGIEFAHDLRSRCFRGGYHITPFHSGEGHGVTLVNLDTGQRKDFIYSPIVPMTDGINLDFPIIAFSPDFSQLLLIGMGLGGKEYQSYVRWKIRIPKPSLLSYAVDDLKFDEMSTDLKEQRKKGQEMFERDANQLMINFAGSGNIYKIKMLLDYGIDVNIRYPETGDTALISAAMGGHANIVELLLERGADVILANKNSHRAIDVAQNEEIKRLLSEAENRVIP